MGSRTIRSMEKSVLHVVLFLAADDVLASLIHTLLFFLRQGGVERQIMLHEEQFLSVGRSARFHEDCSFL